MSAFIVSDAQISAILQGVYGQDYAGVNIWKDQNDPKAYHFVAGLLDQCQIEANCLMAENVRSVNHLYPNAEAAESYPVELDLNAKPMPALHILKLIDCLEYQSCECPDWEQSEACKLLAKYRKLMIPRLMGYDAAPWSI